MTSQLSSLLHVRRRKSDGSSEILQFAAMFGSEHFNLRSPSFIFASISKSNSIASQELGVIPSFSGEELQHHCCIYSTGDLCSSFWSLSSQFSHGLVIAGDCSRCCFDDVRMILVVVIAVLKNKLMLLRSTIEGGKELAIWRLNRRWRWWRQALRVFYVMILYSTFDWRFDGAEMKVSTNFVQIDDERGGCWSAEE